MIELLIHASAQQGAVSWPQDQQPLSYHWFAPRKAFSPEPWWPWEKRMAAAQFDPANHSWVSNHAHRPHTCLISPKQPNECTATTVPIYSIHSFIVHSTSIFWAPTGCQALYKVLALSYILTDPYQCGINSILIYFLHSVNIFWAPTMGLAPCILKSGQIYPLPLGSLSYTYQDNKDNLLTFFPS